MSLLKNNILVYITIVCAINFIGCTHQYDGFSKFENGFYITSIDKQASFFCKAYYLGDRGVNGINCKDMTCKLAGDQRVTIDVVLLKQAVIIRTEDFQYRLIGCGGKK